MLETEEIFGYPLIHQYAQDAWHGESLIFATDDGLRALRAAIDHALEHGTGFTTATANDGESFFALVVKAEEADFEGAQAPYCDPSLFATRRGAGPGILRGVEDALALAYTRVSAHREAGQKASGE